MPAQEMPKPAPQLAKFEKLAGHWQGGGTATMQPGQPATKWTAVATYQWVMNGFWLQCDTAIEFPGMGTMRFREYLGWDGENQRYVNLAVNNMGEGVLGIVHPTDTGIVMMIPSVRDGQPQCERAITNLGADRIDFAIAFLAASGPAADAVSGELKKVDQVQVPELSAAKAMMPAAPAMARLARMAGTYDVVGEVIMGPGQPAMKIKGRDVITAPFDGSLVMVETKGSSDQGGPPYEAHGFYAWNATDKCYRMLAIDNMGVVVNGDCRLIGQDLVLMTSGMRMGAPIAARTVLSLDADGHPTKVVNHSLIGTSPPMQDFTGSYTRAK
jgi:hypothetical protein